MASNRPRPCARCVAESKAAEAEGIITGIKPEWLPCAVCNEPTCEDHGRDYPGGFEHEECHEDPMYSRYDG